MEDLNNQKFTRWAIVKYIKTVNRNAIWLCQCDWENYGGKTNDPCQTWHIDHIIAQSKFKYESLDDLKFKECWALSNLRPLEKIANMKKGDR